MSLRELEKELLEQKPWQLRGEVEAKTRPKNSLLTEDIKFSRRIIIGQESDALLAPQQDEVVDPLKVKGDYFDILIKNRICHNLFDNVEPLELVGNEEPQAAIESTELKNVKDTSGLATTYIKGNAVEDHEKQGAMVSSMWQSVQRTLDSLCVDVHIPKPVVVLSSTERAEHEQLKAL